MAGVVVTSEDVSAALAKALTDPSGAVLTDDQGRALYSPGLTTDDLLEGNTNRYRADTQITWLTISTSGTSAVNTFERIAAASLTRTLPAIAVNDYLVYHAAAASVVISTPHTIKQGSTTVCAPADTLTLAQGETVWLVANSTSEMGIV